MAMAGAGFPAARVPRSRRAAVAARRHRGPGGQGFCMLGNVPNMQKSGMYTVFETASAYLFGLQGIATIICRALHICRKDWQKQLSIELLHIAAICREPNPCRTMFRRSSGQTDAAPVMKMLSRNCRPIKPGHDFHRTLAAACSQQRQLLYFLPDGDLFPVLGSAAGPVRCGP